jgi:hypothetical protein
VYMGQPPVPGGQAFMIAFNERTGMIMTGIGTGLAPHPALPGVQVLQLQNPTQVFP